MAIDIERLIAGQDAARKFVSEHAKGGGAVGFGDLEPGPLVIETVEVRGKTHLIKTEEGIRKVSRKSRVVTLANGKLEVIKKGIGSQISEDDALKVLPPELKRKLTKSLAS